MRARAGSLRVKVRSSVSIGSGSLHLIVDFGKIPKKWNLPFRRANFLDISPLFSITKAAATMEMKLLLYWPYVRVLVGPKCGGWKKSQKFKDLAYVYLDPGGSKHA